MCRAERQAARLARWAAAALLGMAAALQAPARPAAVEVIDDEGRTVQLATPAKRIVSLAPHLTELLFAAGAGDRLVGAVEWSDHPEAARRVPRIGNFSSLDLERIVALQPDLVVAWGSGNPAGQVKKLEALGIRVFRSEPRRSTDIADNLRRLGRLAGTESVANPRADAFEREIATLRARYAARPVLRVFYQIWHQPLMTVSDRHLIGEALQLCGARNVFGELPVLAPTVAAEAVIAADPDVIVSGSGDAAGARSLEPWRRVPTLRATRAGHLLSVDPDRLHRASDRFAAGARELCEALDRARTPAR
jgi:iron complex transport system substrate-binding protein